MNSSNKHLYMAMNNNKGANPWEETPELKREKASDRPFTKVNYYMMGGCLLLIVVGFLLMSGGGSSDATEFDPAIFSTRRIVVGPLLAFLGFLCMAFAIIWTPGKKKNKKAEK